tara:strand:- start:395 stop:886 length:492 start_codon:yes stop_codon:yes gene_type:complete
MKRLFVPKTRDYLDLKSEVLGEFFPWYRTRNQLDDFYFYSHVFLERPEVAGFPKKISNHLELFQVVFTQICQNNDDMEINYLLRMNGNAIEPLSSNPKIGAVHEDHTFPHKNVIIYLTDAGGETICGDEKFFPEEDSACLFEGPHCHALPEKDRRVVLVVTYA